LSAARNIIRELQALGAHLVRDGDRLILRAGSRPIPQLLVQRARDAKRELLALDQRDQLAALRVPREDRLSPTIKKPVASLGENDSESRGKAGGLLRMPVGTLSGTLRRDSADLAPLGGGGAEQENKDFRGFLRDGGEFNQRVRGEDNRDLSKGATPSETLAPLAIGQVLCGSQPPSPPKDATPSWCKGPSHAAAQQNAAGTESYETSGSATVGSSTLRSACCECGTAIAGTVNAWWGGQPCHRDCGEAAWRREWRRYADDRDENYGRG
jgi:hypothetical protein